MALTRARERLYITTPSISSFMRRRTFVEEILEEFESKGEVCEVVKIGGSN